MIARMLRIVMAILARCVPIDLPQVLPLQALISTLSSQNLLAQTPEPSLFPEAQPTPTPTPPIQKPRVTQGSQWGLCRRKQHVSHRSSGFTGDTAGTYIRDIQVNLYSNTYSTVTLNWANENSSTEILPIQFNASPGAGNCALDCRSIAQSQQPGSHCTSLSPPTYLVQGYDCALTKYPEAKYVTWFNAEREIAFHAYTVPPYPASHGCIRLLTKNHGAEWIYDNTLAGITQVKIDWNPLPESLDFPQARLRQIRSTKLSPKCWSGDQLIDRQKTK
jgi:L,D-transpeptidase catalytic domain